MSEKYTSNATMPILLLNKNIILPGCPQTLLEKELHISLYG